MISHSKPDIGPLEKNALVELVDSSMLSSGIQTSMLEQTISNDSGYPDSIAVTSASLGIYIILKYRFPLGGGRIALSSYICRSIWDAIKMAGCIPVLYDINPETLAIDITKVDYSKIDIAIVAHMFGIRAHYETLQDYGIEVIEDCAQRIPPTFIKEEPRANWRIYSFDPTKILTCGQGGIISGINKSQMIEIRKMLSGVYDNIDCLKVPFTDLQASIARVQWRRLDEFLERRKKIAEFYNESLSSNNLSHLIHKSMLNEDTWHFRYIVLVNSPDLFIKEMNEYNIACRKPVQPFGLHRLFNSEGFFLNTELATDQFLSLPLYPALTKDDEIKVIQTFIKLCKKYVSKS